MPHHYATRSTPVRPQFEVLAFRAGTRTRPLHIHVRRRASDGAIVSLLVYALTLGAWFEGDDMPPNVRAFALHALAVRLGHAPVFACAAGVRP
jgi:hypothetical protein